MPDLIAPSIYRRLPHGPEPVGLLLPATRASRRCVPMKAAEGWWRSLDPRAKEALAELIRWWPLSPPTHAARRIVDALAATPVLVAVDDGLNVNPQALCAAAAEIDPDGRWLAEQGRCSAAALRALRQRAEFEPGSLPDRIPVADPLKRVVLRTLASRATDHDVAEFAEQFRGELLQRSPPPLRALQSNRALLVSSCASEDPHVTSETLARAFAHATRINRNDLIAVQAAETSSRTSSFEPETQSQAASRFSASRRDAFQTLVAFAVAPAGPSPLLCCNAGVETDWTIPVGLSKINDLEESVRAYLSQRDWLDFDAPGEGELPSIWRDALILAGHWNEDWSQRWKAIGAQQPESLDSIAILTGYAEPSTRATAPSLSSYSHGLHDGTAESYGGVFSPHDPFSDRDN